MRVLDHLQTVLYYDVPQVFIAGDQLGTRYVCMLVEEGNEVDKYLCVPASAHRLNSLFSGELDLRSLYESPETDELYVVNTSPDGLSAMSVTALDLNDVSQDWFPDPGLFIGIERLPDIQVIEEALRRQRAIIHCKLSPPESRDEPKITAEHLGQAVRLFQRLVKHAYRKALKGLDDASRQLLSEPRNYELEIFAFSPGSFTLHMQSAVPADLLGYVQISKALEIIDSISERIDYPDEAVDIVAAFGGHFATAYKDLLRFITETETSIEYEWSIPERRASNRYRISTAQAAPLYKEMIKRVEIEVEEIRLVGRLTKVDKKLRTWRLVSEDDQKEYSGSSEVDLSGLVIQTQRYEFLCDARLEEERSTGREKTKLFLKYYRAL